MFICLVCKSNYLSSTPPSFTSFRSHQTKRTLLPNPKKVPLILRCGHTLCESCIFKLKEKIPKPQTQSSNSSATRCIDLDYKFKLPCPYSDCGVITLLRRGEKELPENMYILSHVENDKDSETRRGFDDIIAGASGDCHVVNKSRDRLKSDCGASGPQNCAIHQRIIEYFCKDDNSLICSRCYIMGDHKDHAIQSLEDVNKLVFSDIENGLVTAKIVLRQLNLLDRKSSSALSDLKANLVSVIAGINQSFMNLHALLQARESEMLDQISTAFKSCILSFEDEKREALNAKWDLKTLMQDAINLLDDTSTVVDGTSIVQKLKKVNHIPCIIGKQHESNVQDSLQWQEKLLTELTTAIQSFGEICGTLDVMKLKTYDEVGSEFDEEDNISVTSDNSSSHPVSDLQSVCSQISEASADVIIESDSENGSELSANSKGNLSEKPKTHKRSKEVKESIVVPTMKGPPHQVIVTHINSPCDFYVQLKANKAKFETLAHNINSWCRKQSSAKQIPQSLEKGTQVLGRFGVDKLWYRASVLDVNEVDVKGEKRMKVKVKYIDFGNEETVLWKDLRMMQERFTKCPAFSVRCSLHDIAPFKRNARWEYASVEKFLMMTNKKILLLNTISVTGNVHFVDLICTPTENVSGDGYASIRDMLVFLEHARFCTGSSDTSSKIPVSTTSKHRTFYKPTALKNGQTVDVIVTEIYSPSDLYIIPIAEEINYYLRMEEEMQEVYKEDSCNLYLVHWPREDMLCAVQGKKGKWYRGQVVEVVSHQEVTVFLPDVGSTLVVSCYRLRKLLTDFIKLPSQAIHCSLKDISPMGNKDADWSQDAKDWCQANVKGYGSARIGSWGAITEIILWLEGDSSQTINYHLMKLGLAESTGLSSLSQLEVTPLFARDRQKSPKTPIQSPKQVGSPAAKVSSMSPSYKKPSPAKSLSPKLLSPIKKSPGKSKARRQISAAEFDKAQGDRSPGGTKDFSGKSEKKEGQSKTQERTDAAGEKGPNSAYVEVIICNYQSPGHFYIRMQENEIMLNDLMEDLQEMYRDSPAVEKEDWRVNDFCAVRSSEDNKWYRGKIKTLQSMSEIDVEFLDFGYEQKVSSGSLRILKHELGVRLHCAAVRCYLANLLSAGSSDAQTWTKTAIEFMSDRLKDKKLFLKTEGDPTDQGLPVDMIIEEEIPPTAFEPVQHSYHSLRNIMQEEGLAMENKVRGTKSLTGASVGDALEKKIYQKNSPKAETPLHLQEEEGSKDSGNISSSPRELKEMQSPTGTMEKTDDSLTDDTLVEGVEAPSYDIPRFPFPSLGEELEVLPTFVDYSCIIYAQPVKWEAAIVHLTEEMQRLYDESEEASFSWKPGQTCVAKFSDDERWYRGVIKAVGNDKAMIFYPDFGNSSWVSVSSLRPILPEVASQHVVSYSCVLDNVIPNSEDGLWQVPVLGIIHEMLVNCHCILLVTGVDEEAGLIKVKVKKSEPQGWDLSTVLVEKGYAISDADLGLHYELSRRIGDVLVKTQCYLQRNPGDVGDEFNAMLTQVELPNLIYLQKLRQSEEGIHDFVLLTDIAELNKGIDEFEEMMAQINSTSSLGLVQLPSVGLLCQGQFSSDNSWYRAICIEQYPEQDACLMFYIDYGNSEIITRDRMRILPTEYLSMPALSFRCFLNLVPPGSDGLWHKGSLDAMAKTLFNKELRCTITQKSPLTVQLRIEGEDGELKLAYDDVISKGLALLPEQQIALNAAVDSQACNGDVEVEEDKSEEEEE